MSNQENSSNDILYRALYDGEEYSPWNSLQSNNSRTRRKPDHLFLNGTPSWGNTPAMINSQFAARNDVGTSSQDNAQSRAAFDMCPSSSLEKRNIKLQWESRAEEFGLSIGSGLNIPVHEKNEIDSFFGEFNNGEKDAMCYPKWNIVKNVVSQCGGR